MDEFMEEIRSLENNLQHMKEVNTSQQMLEEYGEEIRNLQVLYSTTQHLFDSGATNKSLQHALEVAGYGAWELPHVYSFVYDHALAAAEDGTAVIDAIRVTDFAHILNAKA